MADLFISYARADDEPFVKRLYEDLTAGGFDVWWDREAMESRGRTFLQEIRDAIAAVDRLILVVGPEAAQSEYVRAEWEFALRVCKVIIPVLRLGDRHLVPQELSKLHCPDFRSTRPYGDALAELTRLTDDPIPPPGTPHGVDAAPEHFIPRPQAMEQLSATVLADVAQPTVITSAKRTAALQGMGGVGKSVLAAAFARACETRRVFLDGIVWVRVGQQPDLGARLRLAGQALGDDVLQHYLDPHSGVTRLSQLLADKVCLLVLDDVWDVAHAEPFANALGPRCRLLITTRDGGLATALGAQEHRLDVLSENQALALLARWADQDVESLPPQARDVADECGNLPLALAMIGATVHGKPSRWANALHRLRNADLKKIRRQFPNYPYPDLLRAIQVSVEALDPNVETRYLDFAVFPEDVPIPETVLQVLWEPEWLDEYDTQDVVDLLVERSLVRRDEDGCLTLHDLQFDYVRRQHADLPALHGRLLDAYAAQCPTGWPSGPSDGYFFESLAHHLVEAGWGDELRALLLDFDWLRAKLAATGVAALMADYEVLVADPDLATVQGALSLSAHVLARGKTQLPGQLCGRLLGQGAPGVQNLVAGATGWRGAAWLRPLRPSLTPPGGPLLRTLAGHPFTAVAVYSDGRRAISASYDRTLKIWDLETGQALRTLEGHTDTVNAVAAYANGRRAISASEDKTLKIWDLETGQTSRTLEGHTQDVEAVAVYAGGRRAISASWDLTLRLWDLETGAALATFGGDSIVGSCDVAPDGRTLVAGDSSGRVHILRLEEPG
jgi:WD40 repeat protein